MDKFLNTRGIDYITFSTGFILGITQKRFDTYPFDRSNFLYIVTRASYIYTRNRYYYSYGQAQELLIHAYREQV